MIRFDPAHLYRSLANRIEDRLKPLYHDRIIFAMAGRYIVVELFLTTARWLPHYRELLGIDLHHGWVQLRPWKRVSLSIRIAATTSLAKADDPDWWVGPTEDFRGRRAPIEL